MKTFDIATVVVEAKKQELPESYRVSEKNMKIFKTYCMALDEIAERGDCKKISVDIVGESNMIQVTIDVIEFVYQSMYQSENYLNILERATDVCFYSDDGEYISIVFTFPTLFEIDE